MESRPAPIAEAVERSAVDAGIYREGKRIASPATVADAVRSLRDEPGSMAWIGLFRPAESQLLAMADEFGCTRWRSRTLSSPIIFRRRDWL